MEATVLAVVDEEALSLRLSEMNGFLENKILLKDEVVKLEACSLTEEE